MSRDGLLPKSISKIHQLRYTPVRIIIFCGIVMSFFAAMVPIDVLADLVNVGTLFAFIVVCAGVLYLRYTQPDMPRPFKAPGMPFTSILGILSCSYLIMHLPWITLMRFVVWMVIGLVIYFIYSRVHSNLNSP